MIAESTVVPLVKFGEGYPAQHAPMQRGVSYGFLEVGQDGDLPIR
jgi:hypothetical protein